MRVLARIEIITLLEKQVCSQLSQQDENSSQGEKSKGPSNYTVGDGSVGRECARASLACAKR
jgi:hypothetical protein